MTAQLRASGVAAGVWIVSDSRTRVTFAVRNLGKPVRGAVTCGWGEVEVGGSSDPVRIIAELDLGSIDTGIARRDADLRKPGLLDIDRHPTMTWTCASFAPDGEGRWVADGVVHVRGTSAPLRVSATAEPQPDGWLRIRGTATLDRTAVGIRAPRFLIGRIVEIDVDAWLSRRCPG
ncbi:YceI family protein [Blastococcus litoris]|uniref:YceI family protein n=1 Tax=Blastococcus litoris TaxID=2171622 RepID=UPI000E3095AD|nr:YceI family protein [Blastococcus litoris]